MRLFGSGLQLSKAILVREASFGVELQILCSSIPRETTMLLSSPLNHILKKALISNTDILSLKQAADTNS